MITGLARELACLPERESMAGAAVGASARRAHEAAAKLISEDKVSALLSFGLAGGLDPALTPGSILVAESVISPEGRNYLSHAPLVEALRRFAPDAVAGSIAGTEAVVARVADKRALHSATGAVAVDMESHAIARAADESGAPFAVLRVIADPASRALPSAALGALSADGKIMSGRVLGRLLRHPWQLPALLLLSLDSEKGFSRLAELGKRDPVAALAGAVDTAR